MANISVHKPPHMRGIKQAIQEIKQSDPNTCLTEKALRRLVLSGELPAVKIGVKYLINMDSLEKYLSGGSLASAAAPSVSSIHRVEE